MMNAVTLENQRRIRSLEKELGEQAIDITLIKDRIRDIEQTMKEKEVSLSKALVDLIDQIRELDHR